jgi:hypothetical protein
MQPSDASIEIKSLQDKTTAATLTAAQIQITLQQIVHTCTVFGLSSTKVTAAFAVIDYITLVSTIMNQVEISVSKANLPSLDSSEKAEFAISVGRQICQSLSEVNIITPDVMAKIQEIATTSDMTVHLLQALSTIITPMVNEIKASKCCW